MATPQSLIQSNIQNAVGTQSLAQDNVPVLANNGDPFTIYNQTPPQGGYLPPVSNAWDQWRINPAPAPVQFNFGSGGYGFPSFGLPPIGGGTGGGGGWVPPTAPPIPPPFTPPGTGGPLPPTPVGQPGPGGGSGGANRFNTGGGWNTPIGGTQFQIGPGYNPVFGGTGSSTSGGGNPFTGLLQQSGLVGSDGKIDWRQVADMVIPGDAWQSSTGEWNIGNVIARTLGTYLGLPVGKIAGYLATNWESAPEWLKSWADQNANAFVQGEMQRINPQISSKMAEYGNALGDASIKGSIAGMGSNPFGIAPTVGWGIGEISPITGLVNGSGDSPFAANPNDMPTGYGAFNPAMPAGPAMHNPGRGQIGDTGAMAGGPGGFGGRSHYGMGVVGAMPGMTQAQADAARLAAQDMAASMGVGATNIGRGTFQSGGDIYGNKYAK